MLEFLPEDILNAAAEQPRLFMDAVEYRVQRMDRRIQAEAAMKHMQAERSLEIREEQAASADRITENKITAMLATDVDLQQTVQAFNQEERGEEYAKLLLEAYRMRRDCLRIISNLTRDEMSLQRAAEANAEKIASTRQRLRDKFPGSQE